MSESPVLPPAGDEPHSLRDEEGVLGAILATGQGITVAIDPGLEPDHFYRDSYADIYAAALRVSQRQQGVDLLTVASELERNGELERVGGRDRLALLAASVPSPGSAPYYAGRIIETARLRQTGRAAKRILEGVAGEDQEAITEGVRDLNLDLSGGTRDPVEPHELAADFFEFLSSSEEVDVMELPWTLLNRYCAGGFRRKQVTILTGPTGEGKSTVLDSLLEHFASQGYRCGTFATEMTHRERMARWLAKQTGIPYHRLILKKDLKAADMKRLLPFVNGEHLPPWSFRNAENWSVQRIGQDLLSRRLDIATIDPINLIPGANKTETMEEIAQQLKVLSTRADCHIIAVAHLTKSASKFKERPTLGDIRQSGMIEANASQVMVLHRERDENLVPQAEGWLGFLKVRDGIPDGIDVVMRPGKYRFDEKGKPPAEQKQDSLAVGGTQTRTYADPEEAFT